MKTSSFLLIGIIVLWTGIVYVVSSSPQPQMTPVAKAIAATIPEEVQVKSKLDCPSSLQTLKKQRGIAEDSRFTTTPLIVIEKDTRHLGLYRRGVLDLEDDGTPKCWKVALAPQAPSGSKQYEGDLRTPEGWYNVSDAAGSSYKDALLVHYPNCQDAKHGQRAGFIKERLHKEICQAETHGARPVQNSPLGGQILIHTGGYEDRVDWTLGCIALSAINLEKLRSSLPASKKTTVLILP